MLGIITMTDHTIIGHREPSSEEVIPVLLIAGVVTSLWNNLLDRIHSYTQLIFFCIVVGVDKFFMR